MTQLPECPHCDSANTLSADRVEPRGVRVCFCSACGRTCRVNAAGAIVHPAPLTDVRGNSMDGP